MVTLYMTENIFSLKTANKSVKEAPFKVNGKMSMERTEQVFLQL